jgi:hypothetical protein
MRGAISDSDIGVNAFSTASPAANCSSTGLVAGPLTTGYFNLLQLPGAVSFSTNFYNVLPPFPNWPPDKCIHGKSTADSSSIGGAGINKDSPVRAGYSFARVAATLGTKDFVKLVIADLAGDDDAICGLLGQESHPACDAVRAANGIQITSASCRYYVAFTIETTKFYDLAVSVALSATSTETSSESAVPGVPLSPGPGYTYPPNSTVTEVIANMPFGVDPQVATINCGSWLYDSVRAVCMRRFGDPPSTTVSAEQRKNLLATDHRSNTPFDITVGSLLIKYVRTIGNDGHQVALGGQTLATSSATTRCDGP